MFAIGFAQSTLCFELREVCDECKPVRPVWREFANMFQTYFILFWYIFSPALPAACWKPLSSAEVPWVFSRGMEGNEYIGGRTGEENGERAGISGKVKGSAFFPFPTIRRASCSLSLSFYLSVSRSLYGGERRETMELLVLSSLWNM